MRARALYSRGGIYLDTDVELPAAFATDGTVLTDQLTGQAAMVSITTYHTGVLLKIISGLPHIHLHS